MKTYCRIDSTFRLAFKGWKRNLVLAHVTVGFQRQYFRDWACSFCSTRELKREKNKSLFLEEIRKRVKMMACEGFDAWKKNGVGFFRICGEGGWKMVVRNWTEEGGYIGAGKSCDKRRL